MKLEASPAHSIPYRPGSARTADQLYNTAMAGEIRIADYADDDDANWAKFNIQRGLIAGSKQRSKPTRIHKTISISASECECNQMGELGECSNQARCECKCDSCNPMSVQRINQNRPFKILKNMVTDSTAKNPLRQPYTESFGGQEYEPELELDGTITYRNYRTNPLSHVLGMPTPDEPARDPIYEAEHHLNQNMGYDYASTSKHTKDDKFLERGAKMYQSERRPFSSSDIVDTDLPQAMNSGPIHYERGRTTTVSALFGGAKAHEFNKFDVINDAQKYQKPYVESEMMQALNAGPRTRQQHFADMKELFGVMPATDPYKKSRAKHFRKNSTKEIKADLRRPHQMVMNDLENMASRYKRGSSVTQYGHKDPFSTYTW